MRGIPRESLKTSSDKLWGMVEDHIERHPELDLEVGMNVLTYSNVGSFNNAREKRPNLSSSKRDRLLQYLGGGWREPDLTPEEANSPVGDEPEAYSDRLPKSKLRNGTAEAAMGNVGAALALLREAMGDLAAYYPEPLWNRNMRELSVLSGQLLKNFPHQGGLRAPSDK